jgi:hypothetical protein
MDFLVNTDTGEVLGRIALGRRVRVESIKRGRTIMAHGRLWTDQPFAAVPGERDESVPDGHVVTGESAAYDSDGGKVIVGHETRPMTAREQADTDVVQARGDLAKNNAEAPDILEAVIADLPSPPRAAAAWYEARQAIKAIAKLT